jgi:hypothetical protein
MFFDVNFRSKVHRKYADAIWAKMKEERILYRVDSVTRLAEKSSLHRVSRESNPPVASHFVMELMVAAAGHLSGGPPSDGFGFFQ